MMGTAPESAAIETIGELVSDSNDDTIEDARPLPKPLATLGWASTIVSLFVLPICFGGVHETVLFSVQMFTLLCGAVFLTIGALGRTEMQPRGMVKAALLFLSALIIWAGIQSLLLGNSMIDHPLLGKIPAYRFGDNVTFFCLNVLTFLSSFYICTVLISSGPRDENRSRMISLVLAAGGIIACIALSHWFSDNGKLFGTFAPENIFISDRMRWPFVNSNHLAQFLLIPFFILLGKVRELCRNLLIDLKHFDFRRRSALADLVSSKKMQRHFLSAGCFGSLFLLITISIVGTLSRNSLIAVAICSLLFLGLDAFLPRLPREDGRRKGVRSRRRREAPQRLTPVGTFGSPLAFMQKPGVGRHIGQFFLILFAVGSVFFFLNERGRELFSDRLEYGLVSSRDDLRWQLYVDTLPILRQHAVIGIGPGGWSNVFSEFMSEPLAGMNPGYLHSDPMQFALELGMPGVLLLLALAGTLLFSLWVPIRRSAVTLGCCCGVVAVIIASTFDFPFHIPAISAIFSISLAILATSALPARANT